MRVTALSFQFTDTHGSPGLIARRLCAVLVAMVLALVAGAVPAQAAAPSGQPAVTQPAVAVAGGSISGTVTDAATGLAIDGVCVTVSSPEQADPIDPITVCSGLDGAYLVSGLPADRPLAVTFAPPADSWYVAESWQGWRNGESWDPIYLTDGEARTGVDAQLVTGGRVSGRVTNSAGTGLGGITVYLARATEWGSETRPVATSGADGNYLTPILEAGAGSISFTDYVGPYLDSAYGDTVISPGATTPNVDGVMVAGGTVSGTVLNADGTPATGACVALEPVSGGAPSSPRCADATGSYTTAGVPSGDYYVQFSSFSGPDFFPTQYLGGTFTTDGAAVVQVTANVNLTGQDHTIVLGGVISGRITSAATGLGVSACLSVVQGSEWNWMGSACTDDAGNYRVVGLATGTYEVHISPNDPAYTSEWFHDQSTFLSATAVDVTFGSTLTIDESLTSAASVSGMVVDATTGDPIAGAFIMLRTPPVEIPGGPPAVPGSTGLMANTDVSGHYTVTRVPAGNYLVQVMADGFVTEWYDNQTWFTTATVVAVAEAQAVTNIDFGLVRTASLSLTVTDTSGVPLPGVSVTVWSTSGGFGGTTNASGVWTTPTITPGDYVIEFNDPSGTYPRQFYDRSLTREAASTVTVLAGTPLNLTAALIRSEPAASISGTVADNDGAPLPGASVEAYLGDATAPSATATTDVQGRYSLPGLTAGTYQVRFTAADPAAYQAEWFDNATDRSAATPVAVVGAVEGINATLTRATVSASGRVTDAATGLPLAGVTVAVYVRAGVSPLASVTTDAAGHYAVTDLRPGLYTVGFSLDHYAPRSLDVDLTISRTGVDAALTPLPGSIAGTITGAGGSKDRLCVQVWAMDGTTKVGAPVCIANGGAYLVSGLVPGSYLVSVTQKNGQTTWYVQAASAVTATPVVVGNGAAVTGIDISVKGKPKA